MTLGGQAEPIFPANISYGAPQISFYTGIGANDPNNLATTGSGASQSVYVNGLNFGPGPSTPNYASYFQPKRCPFLNTANSVQKGSTFCSKIVAEALQFAGNCEVEDLIPCTTTPSCLFAAFQDSQRKVLSSVPYKREQLRQGVLM